VFEGKRGEVSTGNEIGAPADRRQKTFENAAVLIRGRGYPHRIALQPTADLPPGYGDVERPFKNAGIGGQTQESEQTRPG